MIIRLYYSDGQDPNFGDAINPWFWNSSISNKFDPNDVV